MISNKIMKVYESEVAVTYKAACDCGANECDLILDIEKDSKLNGMLFLNMYKTLSYSYYGYSDNWIKDICWRIVAAFKLLFTGRIEMEADFVMREEQMKEFIKALQEAMIKLNGEVD